MVCVRWCLLEPAIALRTHFKAQTRMRQVDVPCVNVTTRYDGPPAHSVV